MDSSFGDILREYQIKLKKRLGQHFITDPRLLAFLAQYMAPDKSFVVLEIGAGIGSLTRALCERTSFVYAVEFDKDLMEAAQAITKDITNLQWIWGDALEMDLSGDFLRSEHPGHPLLLCGNLPYYITSELLYKALIPRTRFSRMAFLVQEEVAQRMAGIPGEKSFGRLALWCQYRAFVSLGKKLPKGAFLPNPEVVSRLVTLEIKNEFPLSGDQEILLDQISREVFSLRRKTLANGLKGFFLRKFAQSFDSYWPSFVERTTQKGIELSRRPEDLSIDEFVMLVREVSSLSS